MGFQRLFLQITLFAAVLAAAGTNVSQLPKHCFNQKCGNLLIPLPFITSPECSLSNSFLITCNYSFWPHKAFIQNTGVPILAISLDGHIRVSLPVAIDCDNNSTDHEFMTHLSSSGFFISSRLNKFTVVGCNIAAVALKVRDFKLLTGCISICNHTEPVTYGTCSGVGCCQSDLPKGNIDYHALTYPLDAPDDFPVQSFNRSFNRSCSYVFVIAKDSFNYTASTVKELQKTKAAPVVLDWAVGNKSCLEAQKNQSSYACLAHMSECNNYSDGSGYLCRCRKGYGKNPYIVGGCRDVNECESNPCVGTCTNSEGSYRCSCPKGHEGDGRKDGNGCRRKTKSDSKVLKIALGVVTCLLIVTVIIAYLCWMWRKRSNIKQRQQFFQLNGGAQLLEELSKHVDKGRIFTSEDLKKATNNYDESRIIGRGGFGIVYRGILKDNTVVAIKKSKEIDRRQVEEFINEIAVLTRLDHRNVVKLIGCCLETEVPLLVYEFVNHGTLSHHIHDEELGPRLTWEKRLKIASETAGAIAYLHSETTEGIIHRDIKTANILLDGNYTAKVADFGASRLIPQDCTQRPTAVQGTFGYVDPEYARTNRLTEKSDVFSFGVVLAELLTGQAAVSLAGPDYYRNLGDYFISSIKANQLYQILDPRIRNDASSAQIDKVAALTRRCLRSKSVARPTMKEVATELDGLRKMKMQTCQDQFGNPDCSTSDHQISEDFVSAR